MADVVDGIPDRPRLVRPPRKIGHGRHMWHRANVWLQAQQAEALVEDGVRKRGKNVLEEILVILMDMAMKFKPAPADGDKNPHEDRALFDRYIVLAMKCAAEVAPYQSPKAFIIKSNGQNGASEEYNLDKLSDEQLLMLRTLMLAAKASPGAQPVTIDMEAARKD